MTANGLLALIPEAIKDKYRIAVSTDEEALLFQTDIGFFSAHIYGECEVDDEGVFSFQIKTPDVAINLFRDTFYFTLINFCKKPIIKK